MASLVPGLYRQCLRKAKFIDALQLTAVATQRYAECYPRSFTFDLGQKPVSAQELLRTLFRHPCPESIDVTNGIANSFNFIRDVGDDADELVLLHLQQRLRDAGSNENRAFRDALDVVSFAYLRGCSGVGSSSDATAALDQVKQHTQQSIEQVVSAINAGMDSEAVDSPEKVVAAIGKALFADAVLKHDRREHLDTLFLPAVFGGPSGACNPLLLCLVYCAAIEQVCGTTMRCGIAFRGDRQRAMVCVSRADRASGSEEAAGETFYVDVAQNGKIVSVENAGFLMTGDSATKGKESVNTKEALEVKPVSEVVSALYMAAMIACSNDERHGTVVGDIERLRELIRRGLLDLLSANQ